MLFWRFRGIAVHSQCEKGFFSQFHEKIHNSVVIKLFVKIFNETFLNEIKIEHFQVDDLVTVCFHYGSEMLCTRCREPV